MNRLVNDAFETLQPYVPGKPIDETERELGITGVVKLASNENPLGPSPLALEAIRKALPRLHEYPDGSCHALRQALARFHGVGHERLIFGNGTNEIIEMLIRTCVRPGEHMLYIAGSFLMYKLSAQGAGCPLREVPLAPDMRYDLQAVADAADAQSKIVFLGNPDNPTGSAITRRELEGFLQRIPENLIVVLDEAYRQYVTADDYGDGVDYLDARERLVVLRTFSKAYGLAGVRVGYGMTTARLADYVNRGREPFNVNTVAQVAALAALADTDHVQRTCALNRQEMARVVPLLRTRGLRVWDSQGNFVLVDFGRDGQAMFRALLHRGVIVRPLPGYGLMTHARVSIGLPEENDKLLCALDEVL